MAAFGYGLREKVIVRPYIFRNHDHNDPSAAQSILLHRRKLRLTEMEADIALQHINASIGNVLELDQSRPQTHNAHIFKQSAVTPVRKSSILKKPRSENKIIKLKSSLRISNAASVEKSPHEFHLPPIEKPKVDRQSRIRFKDLADDQENKIHGSNSHLDEIDEYLNKKSTADRYRLERERENLRKSAPHLPPVKNDGSAPTTSSIFTSMLPSTVEVDMRTIMESKARHNGGYNEENIFAKSTPIVLFPSSPHFAGRSRSPGKYYRKAAPFNFANYKQDHDWKDVCIQRGQSFVPYNPEKHFPHVFVSRESLR